MIFPNRSMGFIKLHHVDVPKYSKINNIMHLTHNHMSPSNMSCSIFDSTKNTTCHESVMCIVHIEIINVTHEHTCKWVTITWPSYCHVYNNVLLWKVLLELGFIHKWIMRCHMVCIQGIYRISWSYTFNYKSIITTMEDRTVMVGHVYVVKSLWILVLGLGFHMCCTLWCHMLEANQVIATTIVL